MVGGYFGGRLAEAGHEVGFIARGETLSALHGRGLRLRTGEATATVTHYVAGQSAADAVEQLSGVDVVIVATKALTENATFADIETLPNAPIVTTHNSVEVHFTAADIFGPQRVLAGVVRGYLTRTAPAEITLNPGPLSLKFGLLPGVEQTPPVAQPLVDALTSAGIEAQYYGPDGAVLTDVWMKAMFVATTGVLGAVAGRSLGYLRTELYPQLRGLMEEINCAGRALGVDLPVDAVETNPAGLLPPGHRGCVARGSPPRRLDDSRCGERRGDSR